MASPLLASPLLASSARIAAIDQYIAFDVGRPSGQGWVACGDIVGKGHLDAFFDQMAAGRDGRPLPRDTSTALLGAAFVAAVVGPAVALLALEHRTPRFSPDDLWLHRHPDGYFDRVAYADGRFAVLPDDPAAEHADARVVVTLDELTDGLATAVVDCLEPLLTGVRGKGPFGLRGLWGFVADEASAVELLVAPDDPPTVSDAFVDAVAALVPHLQSRPVVCTIDAPDGPRRFSVRSVCCLWYKAPSALDRRATGGFGYCSTCPLPDEAERRAQLRALLDEPR